MNEREFHKLIESQNESGRQANWVKVKAKIDESLADPMFAEKMIYENPASIRELDLSVFDTENICALV